MSEEQKNEFFDRDANLEAANDVFVVVLKVAVGTGLVAAVPVVGPVIPIGAALTAEMLGNVLPNLRRQRLETLVQLMGQEIESLQLEVNALRRRFNTPEFIDLLEDGCAQAAKSVTDERILAVAKMLKNSLNDEQLEYVYSKRLLSLLGELNDVEVLILRSYATLDRHEFWQQHPEVYQQWEREERRSASDDSPERGMYRGYESRLHLLGLLGPTRSNSSEITPLGAELLEKMDHPVSPYCRFGQILNGTEGIERMDSFMRGFTR